MIYRHSVNHNGVWYPAGVEVPKDATSVVETIDEQPFETTVDEPEEEVEELEEYTKSEIMRMKKSELLEIATACGLGCSEITTVAELRRMLVKHYDL